MPELRVRHPGVLLKERFLDPVGITPRQLARDVGVSTRRIADLVAGRMGLSADMAFRLALYFDVPARWWLESQARYEADDPSRLSKLRSIVTPFAGLEHVLVTPDGVRMLDPGAAESAPGMMAVTPELVDQLRAQVSRAPRRAEREPVVVTMPDGRLMLTGK